MLFKEFQSDFDPLPYFSLFFFFYRMKITLIIFFLIYCFQNNNPFEWKILVLTKKELTVNPNFPASDWLRKSDYR